MTEEMRKHYLEYGPFTYPGLYEEYFRSLPDDPSELGHLISHQIIHRVTLREGMYHQIKRMFASYGAKVLELRRVSMGGLVLDGTLGPGGCRELTPRELILLQQTDPA